VGLGRAARPAGALGLGQGRAPARRIAVPLRTLAGVACCESEDQPHLIDGLHRVAAALGGLSRDWRFDRMATVVTPGTGKVSGAARRAAAPGRGLGPQGRRDRLPRQRHYRRGPGRPLPPAAIEGRWATTMRFYAGPTCLVIDELGDLALPAEGASALFQVVTQRYTKTSTIITSNRPITFWGQSWATPPWQQPCSTGSCTAPWSWTSAGTPTAFGTTRPAQPIGARRAGYACGGTLSVESRLAVLPASAINVAAAARPSAIALTAFSGNQTGSYTAGTGPNAGRST